VSLSAAPTFDLLRKDFVCGWRDITGEPWSGVSGRYAQDDGAVWTTNGAGPHNIQMFVLAPDGTVLHCLPGYWESHDLAAELVFAEKLGAVWRDPLLSRAQKDAKFRAMNLEHLAAHSRETVGRSELQGFDKKFEARRAGVSDCILEPGSIQPRYRPGRDDRFKTTDQIVHERMAARPFVPYAEFDVARFTDYGRQKYDKKQALLADVLPKAGPGGLRAKLAGLFRQPAGAAMATDDAATADRRAAKKGALRSLLDATLRRRSAGT
jgi:hypothetical protein